MPLQPTPPRVQGVRVRLRPITPDDYPQIYAMEADPSIAFRWRNQGLTLSPEETIQSLWRGVLLQYLVIEVNTGKVVGLVNCHNQDLMNGTADIAAIASREFRGGGLLLHGVAVLVDVAFQILPLHKLYVACPSFNFEQFASAAERGYLTIEATLTEHYLYGGRRYDKVIASFSRSTWPDVRVGLTDRMLLP